MFIVVCTCGFGQLQFVIRNCVVLRLKLCNFESNTWITQLLCIYTCILYTYTYMYIYICIYIYIYTHVYTSKHYFHTCTFLNRMEMMPPPSEQKKACRLHLLKRHGNATSIIWGDMGMSLTLSLKMWDATSTLFRIDM